MGEISSLINLKGAVNIDNWNRARKCELNCADILEYVTTDVAEPDRATKPEEHKTWRTNRAKAMKIIQTTLKDDKVCNQLSINGWDQDSTDPKYLYDLIRKVIGKVSVQARADIVEEFSSIRRSSFDSMSSFLIRFDLLRKRLEDSKVPIDPLYECITLFNAVKRQYPYDARFWDRKLNEDSLTTAELLAELSVIGNTKTNSTNLTLQVQKTSTATTASTTKTDDKKTSNKDKKTQHKQITCTDCGQSIRDDFKHFPCGHHRNPRTPDCWWYEPEKAHPNWSKKKEAIENKAKTNTGTTAAVGATNTGLATPGSAMIFGNFGFGGNANPFFEDFH
ncbi:hypothetical protein QBC32DRAFT_389893 [Pseudoneurospora amorphoporcata]|uniref:Uncharacterized protein n=1 Tax=Pseudoneurospora amorphoporcata TaxID=241081 RepID=A0AAN6NIS5_9PEZI|nr:hypothetical protein QBC32DRAFT_389893 [Pseudoneurospora amorphoporcata]